MNTEGYNHAFNIVLADFVLDVIQQPNVNQEFVRVLDSVFNQSQASQIPEKDILKNKIIEVLKTEKDHPLIIKMKAIFTASVKSLSAKKHIMESLQTQPSTLSLKMSDGTTLPLSLLDVLLLTEKSAVLSKLFSSSSFKDSKQQEISLLNWDISSEELQLCLQLLKKETRLKWEDLQIMHCIADRLGISDLKDYTINALQTYLDQITDFDPSTVNDFRETAIVDQDFRKVYRSFLLEQFFLIENEAQFEALHQAGEEVWEALMHEFGVQSFHDLDKLADQFLEKYRLYVQNPNNLSHPFWKAPKLLKANPDFMLKCMRFSKSAFNSASDSLKKNAFFMSEVLKIDPDLGFQADESLFKEREFALAVLSQCSYSSKTADQFSQNEHFAEQDFMLKALDCLLSNKPPILYSDNDKRRKETNGYLGLLLNLCHKYHKDNEAIIKRLISISPYFFFVAGEKIKNDKKFIFDNVADQDLDCLFLAQKDPERVMEAPISYEAREERGVIWLSALTRPSPHSFLGAELLKDTAFLKEAKKRNPLIGQIHSRSNTPYFLRWLGTGFQPFF